MNITLIEKQFHRHFFFALALFLIFISVQSFAIELFELASWQIVTFTLMPVLPLIWAFSIYRAKFQTLDEYIQRLTGEAFLWVLGIICFASFI